MPRPFAPAPLRGFLAAHAVPGLELVDPVAGTHTRLVRTGAGAVRVVAHLADLVDGSLRVDVEPVAGPGGAGEAEGPEGADAPGGVETVTGADGLATRLRRWLGLDRPAGVDETLARDAVLAPLVERRPGLVVPGSAAPFETALLAVLGQQVSLGAARTFAARLVAGLGETVGHDGPDGPDGSRGGRLRLLPSPGVLVAAGVPRVRAVTGVTGARAATLVALAAAAVDGLDLEAARDGGPEAVDDVTRRLLRLPGVGPWTAGYVRMRALGDADAFLAGDLVLRRAMGADRPADALTRAEAWRPFRAYAALHLWTDAVPALTGTPQPPTASTRPTARRASGSGR